MPSGPLASLAATTLHYLHLSLAPSSLATYRSGWLAYSRFCSLHRLPTLPLSESSVLLFCSSLAARHVTHASIRVYLSAVSYFSRLSGHSFSPDLFPRIQYLLRGIRRSQGSSLTSPSRAPITLVHLQSLHSCIFSRFSAPDSLMLWSAVTAAFFGLLRASEFTSPSVSSVLPATLLYRHVSFSWSPDVVSLFLPQSKTDQFANGAVVRLFRLDPPICPFTAAFAFHSVHPARSGPFFQFRDGRFLTRRDVVSLLSRSFPSLSALNTHSFRIGGASALAAAGVSDGDIRILGRWSSDSFFRYIRLRTSTLRSHQVCMRGAPSL